MLEIFGALAAILAVGGVVLNNRRRRACFLIWFASNGLSLAVHILSGIWSLAARDGVFLALAVEGWFLWGRK